MIVAQVLAAVVASTAAFASATQVTVPVTRVAARSQIPAGVRAKQDAAFSINRVRRRINDLTDAAGEDPIHSEFMTNEQNDYYITPISLGNGKTYLMDLDTGSSDTWLRGSGCTTTTLANDQSCQGTSVSYNDPALTDLQLSYVDLYGLGVSAGEVYQTTVTMANLTSKIAIGVSEIELSMPSTSDGLLGLAYKELSSINNAVTRFTGVPSNWFDELGLKNSVFGFYLSNYDDGDNGEVTFGGYDSTKYTGNISWFPLVDQVPSVNPVSPGWYTFSLDGWTWSVDASTGVTGGNGNVGTPDSDPNGPTKYTIADTGTTLMIIATTPATAIATALGAVFDNDPAVQGYTVPCTNNLPPVNFHANGATFSIPSSVYTFFNGPDSQGVNKCVLGIVGGGDSLSIFGDVFSRPYYTFFDKVNKRVGYALAVHPSNASATTTTTAASASASATTPVSVVPSGSVSVNGTAASGVPSGTPIASATGSINGTQTTGTATLLSGTGVATGVATGSATASAAVSAASAAASAASATAAPASASVYIAPSGSPAVNVPTTYIAPSGATGGNNPTTYKAPAPTSAYVAPPPSNVYNSGAFKSGFTAAVAAVVALVL